MTNYTEKSKRKRKAKPNRSNKHRIITLLGLIIFFSGIAVYLWLPNYTPDFDVFRPPDGDPLTAVCELESNPHILVWTRAGSYLTDTTGEIVHRLPDGIFHVNWSDDGRYASADDQSLHYTIDLETYNFPTIPETTSYNYIHGSQTHKYALKLQLNDNQVSDVIIYDNQSTSVLLETQTPNREAHWSVNDAYVLLFNDDAPALAQMWDAETQVLSNINLPDDVKDMFGWKDDTTLLYKTPAGRIRTWNRETGESTQFSDALFFNIYRAGGVQHSPNLSANLSVYPNIIGIDGNNNFHYFQPADDIHYSFPVDMSTSFGRTQREHYIQFEYRTTPERFMMYYPATNTTVDGIYKREEHARLSDDGQYILYGQSETKPNSLIHHIPTDSTFLVEENVIGWMYLDGQTYLMYSRPVDNGTTVFYLLNPDTKASCKIGTYYSDSINIQS